MLDEGLLFQYVDDLLIGSPAYNKLSTKYRKNPELSGIVDISFPRKRPKYVSNNSHTWVLSFPKDSEVFCLIENRQLQGKTHGQLRRFLGMAGVCQIWIPNFGLVVKPFFEALKGQDFEPLLGLHGAEKPLKQWKQSVSQPWVWDYQT